MSSHSKTRACTRPLSFVVCKIIPYTDIKINKNRKRDGDESLVPPAEARKAGRVVPIDTRDICRRVDPETKTLPHEQRPASLESWARRRGTLKAGESERHLGLDDVELMLATVQAEFAARNML